MHPWRRAPKITVQIHPQQPQRTGVQPAKMAKKDFPHPRALQAQLQPRTDPPKAQENLRHPLGARARARRKLSSPTSSPSLQIRRRKRAAARRANTTKLQAPQRKIAAKDRLEPTRDTQRAGEKPCHRWFKLKTSTTTTSTQDTGRRGTVGPSTPHPPTGTHIHPPLRRLDEIGPQEETSIRKARTRLISSHQGYTKGLVRPHSSLTSLLHKVGARPRATQSGMETDHRAARDNGEPMQKAAAQPYSKTSTTTTPHTANLPFHTSQTTLLNRSTSTGSYHNNSPLQQPRLASTAIQGTPPALDSPHIIRTPSLLLLTPHSCR